MSSDSSRKLALFDLDGTLLPWDTQLLFSNYVIRKHPWRILLLIPFFCCIPLLILKIWSDRQMKRMFLGYLWKLKKEEIARLVHPFVQDIVFPVLYESLVNRLEEHRRRGDVCVLTTASPSIYANAIGEALKFDRIFSTDVSYGETMNFYPAFPYGNNKGETKVTRLKKDGVLSQVMKEAVVIAYSDSSADMAMLSLASERVLVNPSKSLKNSFPGVSAEALFPPVPWTSGIGKKWMQIRQFLGMWKG